MQEYDKLVRDGIPGIIERSGEMPITHTASEFEYEQRLLAKLGEEAEEFRESGDVDELVDVLEVLHTIREHKGISEERLERLRSDKAKERGGFGERVVLERVES